MRAGFNLLPDVNDDGYDDFGVHFVAYLNPNPDDRINGTYIFFGGEELDAEPDITLEGSRQNAIDFDAQIAGGDFNGDGKGDIVIGYWNSPPENYGEIAYHFGGRWIDGEADLLFNHSEYQGQYINLGKRIGAIGDYNGDGCDDIASNVHGEFELVLFAGSRVWRLDAPKTNIPQQIDFTLNSSPNPFNRQTEIRYTVQTHGKYELTVYDVSGRLVSTIFQQNVSGGSYSALWHAPSAGLYFLCLTKDNGSKLFSKSVCLP